MTCHRSLLLFELCHTTASGVNSKFSWADDFMHHLKIIEIGFFNQNRQMIAYKKLFNIENVGSASRLKAKATLIYK